MKIEQLLNEHKKGVKAKIYNKKPKPLVGPDALKAKAKAKAKASPPKTELEKHSNLASKLKEDVDFQFDMKLAKILKGRGYKGPVKLEQLGMKWIKAIGDIVNIDDGIMVKGLDPEYDGWVAFVHEMGQYAYGAEQGYQTGNAKSVEKNTKDDDVAEGSAGAKYKIKSIGKDKNGDYYISPNTGKKVYKQAKVGDHETPHGEVKSKVSEGSAQEKLYKRHQELRKKSGLPDPNYYKELKATYDLPDEERQSKTKELKNKYNVKEAKRPDRPPPKTDLKVGDDVVADTSKEDYPGGHKERRGKVTRVGQQGVHIKTDDSDEPEWHPYKIVKKAEKDMKEAKQPEAPKPRNFVAKNAKTAGAGKHKDAKKAANQVRGQKHKNKEFAEGVVEGDWDQQSDEMIPPEYDMDPSELSQIRNAPMQDDETIAQIVKMSAKGIDNDQIANYFNMDQDEVENILNQHINDVKSQIDETEMGKIVDYKPGQTATLNTGPGMTTIIDLKKNPTSLTKDPQTGKLTLVSTPQTTAQPGATAQPTIKAGDAVEIGKTTEDILRLAGLK